MKLCEILIPSRERIKLLFKTIDSIQKSAKGANYGISIRIDDNDVQSMERADDLRAIPCVTLYTGPEVGWAYLDPKAYTPMAESADATWVWIMNDDMTIEGEAWDEKLDRVPTTGFWCQPEFHRLGGSTYHRDESSCAPIFINGCWKSLGIHPVIPNPCDVILTDRLKKKGWKPSFLPGITVFHDRNK